MLWLRTDLLDFVDILFCSLLEINVLMRGIICRNVVFSTSLDLVSGYCLGSIIILFIVKYHIKLFIVLSGLFLSLLSILVEISGIKLINLRGFASTYDIPPHYPTPTSSLQTRISVLKLCSICLPYALCHYWLSCRRWSIIVSLVRDQGLFLGVLFTHHCESMIILSNTESLSAFISVCVESWSAQSPCWFLIAHLL
jgi:hypothetical protein